MDETADGGRSTEALLDLAIESWRFHRLFGKALSKLEAGDANRFVNQHRYFLKRIEESLAAAGLRLVNLEGMGYDPGMAATALNVADFGPADVLVVDQMIEPVVMGETGLIRTGTIMLRRVDP